MGECKTCKKQLADIHYVFCSALCQGLYYQMTEKAQPFHDFKFSFADTEKCAICGILEKEHNSCQFCDELSKGKLKIQEINGEKSIICTSCIETNQTTVLETNQAKQQVDKSYNKIGIEHVVPINYGITYRQELYNTKIMSIEELRSKTTDETEFINLLLQRYDKLKSIIHEQEVEQLAIAKKLRDIGALAKEEFRKKLKESDEKYQPEPVKKLNVSIKKAKLSPLERIVQSVALAKNISIEEARQQVMANPDFMNLTKPGAE